MSVNDFLVRRVIDEVRPFFTPDGGQVELLSYESGKVRVSYFKGVNDDCPTCIMTPEDFEEYLRGLYSERVPDVTDVEVVEAS